MKTVFITSFHSFISKNILNTDALSMLRDEPDVRVVILVPEDKAEFFRTHYGSDRVLVEGIDTARIVTSRANGIFSRIFLLMIDSHYLWYKRVERRDARGGAYAWLKYGAESVFVSVLSGSKALARLARWLHRHLTKTNLFDGVFESHEPDLVFSTDVFDPSDIQFLKEAEHRGIRTLGMIRSWDNCYSKGLLPILPDDLLVNNRLLKEEVVTLHGYPEKRVTVVGCPQFDAFVNGHRTPREEFFASIGVDQSKRLVVFAPAGAILSDTDWQICEILDKARESGKFTHDVHFFVRNHPGHPADLSRFKGSPHFTIQDPGHVFDAGNRKTTELDPGDQRFLADLMYHSDVVTYVATSLSLDATVFDKPQIMIDFDGYEKRDYKESVARYHDEDHMKKLIATGGVKVVQTPDELVAWVRSYLDDPGLDADGRKKIVDEQLYRVDGKAGECVAKKILESL